MNKLRFPRIGMRIIRSAAAVALCYAIYLLRGKTGIPFYAMIGALFCIQPYAGKTYQMAVQRAAGTLIGAVFGLIAILLEIYAFGIYDSLAGYMLNAVMIIPVLYTTVLLKKQNTAYFSCVVYLSIAVNHMTDANPFIFVANRVLDTFIGIAVGIAVNFAKLPVKKVRDCLFVGELDDMLTPVKGELSPYSRIEINRMIENGMQFTIASMRTPASLVKPLSGVELRLPVIAMDGAVLYDMRENSYLKAYVISHGSSTEMAELIRSEGLNCFINALCDDTLMIYYDKLENEAELDMFNTLRRSPMRNYVRREPSAEDRTIYLLTIDRPERIDALYDKLSAPEYSSRFRIVRYDPERYSGYRCIKIYNKNASAENMMRYLMESQNISEKQVIGAENSVSADLDSIVRELKKRFEPIFFRKSRRGQKRA